MQKKHCQLHSYVYSRSGGLLYERKVAINRADWNLAGLGKMAYEERERAGEGEGNENALSVNQFQGRRVKEEF